MRGPTGLRRQRRELAEARVGSTAERYARSQADDVPNIVAGAKKRAAQVSAGKLRGGHEADVAEAAQAPRAADDEVRDDDVITVDLTAPRSRPAATCSCWTRSSSATDARSRGVFGDRSGWP